MGRGRAPCCDKSKVKKGPWSPAEDLRLTTFIQKRGHGNWRALPKQAGLLRCGKSCRLRWINYLRPDVKRGNFSPEEEETVIKLHNSWGNKWSKIASQLPGRTDNEIKNVWNTHLKKRRLTIKDADHNDKDENESSLSNYCSSPSSASNSSNQDMKRVHGEKDGGDFATETETNEEQELILETKSTPTRTTNETKKALISSSSSCCSSICSFGTIQQNIDQVMEIPFDSDADFWRMLELDNLNSFVSSNEAQQNECEANSQGSDFEREVECRKWLRYFEHELGLVPVGTNSNGDQENQTSMENAATTELVTETPTDDIEMMLSTPEIHQAMAYFSMWPSSPHSFGT